MTVNSFRSFSMACVLAGQIVAFTGTNNILTFRINVYSTVNVLFSTMPLDRIIKFSILSSKKKKNLMYPTLKGHSSGLH